MRIKKGDKVRLMAGKDKGKEGTVIQVFPDMEKVVVEGTNIGKKHMRPRQAGTKGQVIEYSSPVAVSNVMLVCPKCGKPTRVSMKERVRMCKKCETAIA